jgi:hypothetical protein
MRAAALSTIARDLRRPPAASRGVMTFGSWAVNVESSAAFLRDELALLFRQTPDEVAAAAPRRGAATLHLLAGEAPPGLGSVIEQVVPAGTVIPADGFIEARARGVAVFCTEMVRVLIVAGRPPTIYIATHAALPAYERRVHLTVAMNAVLFQFRRVLLHAGAVRLGERVHLFVGERGAGKTTITLRLAAAGGTLLCDDHVVIRRGRRDFTVSGCSARARLTADTERFVCARPLRVAAQDFAGVLKKDVDAGDLCASRPFRDYRADAVYFPRLGTRFHLRPMPRNEGMAALLRHWRSALRFRDAVQLEHCLDFFAAFAAQVDLFELELSPRLADLDQLAAALSRDTAVSGRRPRIRMEQGSRPAVVRGPLGSRRSRM